MRLSVTARIALLSITLALASNLFLVAAIWRQTRSEALDAVRRETVEQADALITVYRSGGTAALVGAIGQARVPGDRSQVLAVLDASGRPLAGVAPRALDIPLRTTSFRIAPIGTAPTARDVAYALRPAGDGWLLTGRGLDLLAAEQRALGRALGIAALLSLGFGVAAGLVLARFVGRRLDRIATVIDAAGEGDLSRRVGVGAAGDAFDRLAGRLDAMLERIERLMGELRVVTDSLAHDLRSPIARLRSRAEQAVLADPAARDTALGALIAETDLVMHMLTTAIEISRSEAVARDRLQPARPAALVEQIAELYAPVVEDSGLAFALVLDADPPAMPLHRELLSQAVANLIDNALKHGAAGGALTLRLTGAGTGPVAIAVEDRGPGIAAADRAQAVKRFGRLDAARSVPGAGLGMALVEAVARLHDGRLELSDNAPGLIARIVLPRESHLA